ADLYSALQSGTVEGWSGGQPQANHMGFRDVLNYYYQYNDFFEVHHLLINNDIWEDLTDEQRKVIEEASDTLTAESFENVADIESEYLEKLSEDGIDVVIFTEDELNTLQTHIRENVWPETKDTLDEDLLNELIEQVQ